MYDPVQEIIRFLNAALQAGINSILYDLKQLTIRTPDEKKIHSMHADHIPR